MVRLGVAIAALLLAAPAAATTGNPTAGKVVFRAKCGTCHTFAAAGTKAKGTSPGPVLTGKRISVAKLTKVLSGSSTGVMPSFIGVLTQKQMADVIAFVVLGSKPK
jgi:mono/diheme cytochrome c family protein